MRNHLHLEDIDDSMSSTSASTLEVSTVNAPENAHTFEVPTGTSTGRVKSERTETSTDDTSSESEGAETSMEEKQLAVWYHQNMIKLHTEHLHRLTEQNPQFQTFNQNCYT
jgi:hypothetical protein